MTLSFPFSPDRLAWNRRATREGNAFLVAFAKVGNRKAFVVKRESMVQDTTVWMMNAFAFGCLYFLWPTRVNIP